MFVQTSDAVPKPCVVRVRVGVARAQRKSGTSGGCSRAIKTTVWCQLSSRPGKSFFMDLYKFIGSEMESRKWNPFGEVPGISRSPVRPMLSAGAAALAKDRRVV
jgi:hypothetical protein